MRRSPLPPIMIGGPPGCIGRGTLRASSMRVVATLRTTAARRGTSRGRSAPLLRAGPALAGAGKSKPKPVVLGLVPRGADAEDGAALGDDVERRDDLGEQRRVAVRHAGDERAELHALGARGECAEQGVRLEDRFVGPAERRQLPEVVHHPHRLEAARFGGRARARRCGRTSRRRCAPAWRKPGICNPKVVMAGTLCPAAPLGDCRRDRVGERAQGPGPHRLDLDDRAVVSTNARPVTKPCRTHAEVDDVRRPASRPRSRAGRPSKNEVRHTRSRRSVTPSNISGPAVGKPTASRVGCPRVERRACDCRAERDSESVERLVAAERTPEARRSARPERFVGLEPRVRILLAQRFRRVRGSCRCRARHRSTS